MITLVYDGSLHAGWVARYAVRMAMTTGSAQLRVVHALDRSLARAAIDARIDALELSALEAGVTLTRAVLPETEHVFEALAEALPRGRHEIVVCGTRVRQRRSALLGATISERLLRTPGLRTLAVRIVHPGLLGAPRRFLLPLRDGADSARRAWPFLERLAPGAEELTVLCVVAPGVIHDPRLYSARVEGLVEAARWRAADAITALSASWPGRRARLDQRVVVSNRWWREVLLHANERRAQLIVIGSSERTLPVRWAVSNPIERVLAQAPCDVAVFGAP